MNDRPTIYLDLEVDYSIEEYDLVLEESIIINKVTGEIYKESFEIIPSFEMQELQTKDKYLDNNIAVHPIGVSSVTNPFGGNTVIIGGN